jgi:hypothetical protein
VYAGGFFMTWEILMCNHEYDQVSSSSHKRGFYDFLWCIKCGKVEVFNVDLIAADIIYKAKVEIEKRHKEVGIK